MSVWFIIRARMLVQTQTQIYLFNFLHHTKKQHEQKKQLQKTKRLLHRF